MNYKIIIPLAVILVVGASALYATSQKNNQTRTTDIVPRANVTQEENLNPTNTQDAKNPKTAIEKIDRDVIANYDTWEIYENLVYGYAFSIPPGFQNYNEYNSVFATPDPRDSGVNLVQQKDYQNALEHEYGIPISIRVDGSEGDSLWDTSSDRYKSIKVGKNTYAKVKESEEYQINQGDTYVYLSFKYLYIDQPSINAILDSLKFTKAKE